MSIDWPMRYPGSNFGGLSDTFPHKTDLSNPTVRIFVAAIPQK